MTPEERLLWKIFGDPEKIAGGVPHDHTSFVEGCFRCDLNRDEMGLDEFPSVERGQP